MGDYREHAVDPRLEPFVACYWTHDVTSARKQSHPVLPDGCIDILFESRSETLIVVGTMTKTLWVEHRGPTQFVGARFKAGGAVPFLRERADVFTDDTVEAAAVLGSAGLELEEQLLAGASIKERVRVLERFLIQRLERTAIAVDPRIEWSTSRLVRDSGCRIDSLATSLGMSRQYVRRLFLEHTGLSPKAFARVARLKKLVAAMPSIPHLAEAALASGYADQSHMTREFKELVGVTPAAFLANR